MFEKVAIVGEADLAFAFRAMGISVYSPQNLEEAREVLKELEKEGIALCFLEEGLYEALEPERKDLSQKFCPVVIGYSDYRKISDYLENMMKGMAIKATGTDSLVAKKEGYETR
jgi:vacuolar-type H+-ATPase subunit F/Vma7